MVVGWLKPALLVPGAVLSGLTPQQVEAIIAHELAHIRRHDYLVNFVQTAVETLFFYHPAVWWVSRIVRTEREHCCDDLAVVACGDAVLYARALTAIEALRQEPIGFALAVTGSPLMARVRRLLGVKSPRPVSSSGWIVALVTAMMVSGAGVTRWVKGIPSGFGQEHVVASPNGTSEQADAGRPSPDAVVPFEAEARELGQESHDQIRAMAATLDELSKARAEVGDDTGDSRRQRGCSAVARGTAAHARRPATGHGAGGPRRAGRGESGAAVEGGGRRRGRHDASCAR